jgi:serine/threonine-protein kinase
LSIEVSAEGGTIRVSCAGRDAVLENASPANGFTTTRWQPGPDREVRAVFESSTHESDIKVTCPDGQPRPNIRERAR